MNFTSLAYLKRNDHNVIAVSYAEMANESYPKLVKNIVRVGTVIAAALDNLVELDFDPEKLHIIGHSMGSHVAGHIGRLVNFQVPRITGEQNGYFFINWFYIEFLIHYGIL